jgi:CubicO group peptidase (beta-lactamase class C family)
MFCIQGRASKESFIMLSTRKISAVVLIFGLIFSLFISSQPARAEGYVQPDLQAVDAFLQAQVEANRIPGVAVAIVQNDRIIFLKGYGEAAPGQPVTPQTQFYLGSVTKSLTALAAMQLVEQGKLDLDAPVQKYLPWFEVADPQTSVAIRVRNLLNHTSGLSEKGDPNASAVTSNLEEQAQLLRYVRPNAPVGSQFQYYNQNYRLIGLLIEKVSGQSYGDYLDSHIFAPLGMAASTTHPADAPQLAQGYSRVFGFALPQSQRFNPGGLPSGYVITTAEDMAHYLLAQLNNTQADGSQMLQPALLAQMRTPPAGIGSEYGMGWMVMENGNTLAHGGALEYFQSFVALGLKEKIGFVILYNQNSMENMLFENNALRDGLLALLNAKTPSPFSFGWMGWLLLVLAAIDLLNHLRLFWGVQRQARITVRKPGLWLWIQILVGILLPLGVIFGLPLLVQTLQGGSPTWIEPFRLMPDLTVWLLLGMVLTLVRSLLSLAYAWRTCLS